MPEAIASQSGGHSFCGKEALGRSPLLSLGCLEGPRQNGGEALSVRLCQGEWVCNAAD
jgi:hypothetical protein